MQMLQGQGQDSVRRSHPHRLSLRKARVHSIRSVGWRMEQLLERVGRGQEQREAGGLPSESGELSSYRRGLEKGGGRDCDAQGPSEEAQTVTSLLHWEVPRGPPQSPRRRVTSGRVYCIFSIKQDLLLGPRRWSVSCPTATTLQKPLSK